MPIANKITPFLWFDGQAEAAARHYVSLFPDSKLLGVNPLPSGPGEGAALVEFELEGLKFTALDGGPMYKLTPAVSFVVSCETQEEISTITGMGCWRAAASRSSAAGWWTPLACRGRSCRRSCRT